MKSILLLGCFFSILFSVNGQEQLHCGSDEMHFQLYQEHPELHAGIARASEKLKAFTLEYEQSPEKSNALYTIPVVFHIIHNNGNENISDFQIHDAIKQLNIQFRKQNADTSEIVAAFQSIAADPQIEFKLAQLDPQGNCTSGITRTVSTLTYTGDHAVKSLIHWPPNQYLNIYVCFDAAGLAGHALMPAVADTIPEWDGIVIRHDYVGTIGTSDPFRRTVLSHEVGHYLNLYHIWGGNNVPDFYYLPVGDPGNCAFDDEVADTPNTIGWSSCNVNSSSCGSGLDNVQNYMDYAYCARMFTEGQKTRMHAALNSTVANRNNLWQPTNLIATGIDGTDLLCKAAIYSERTIICTDEPIWLANASYNGATTPTWDIPNSTILNQTNDSIQISFSNPGQYTVGLSITNGSQTIDSNFQNYFTVIPAVGGAEGLVEGFEDGQAILNNQWVFPLQGTELNWEIAPVGLNSGHSFFLNNYDGGANQTYAFHSKPIDLSNHTTIAISFDWAFAQRTQNNNDLLKVQVSTDCGETWMTRKTYSGGTSLTSLTDTLDVPFTPSASSEWNSDTVLVTTSTYFTDHTLVQFRFDSKGGNNFFIDNIRIGDEMGLYLSDEEETIWTLYPNPVKDKLTVKWSGNESPEKISLYNINQQLILEQNLSGSNMGTEIDLNNLNAGIYFIHFTANSGKYVKPLIKL